MTWRKVKRSSNKRNSQTIDAIRGDKVQSVTAAKPPSPLPTSPSKSYSRKGSYFQKRPSLQLPTLLTIAPTNCVDINGKDKQLQQLFLRIAHASPDEFVYNVSMPRKRLADFLEKEYTKEFASFFNWFFGVRPVIDYKYYLDLGEKLLRMGGQLVAHFCYSAFEGFSSEACFRMFRDNFAEKDVMFVNQIREQLQPSASLITYQRQTYDYWKEGGRLQREDSPV